MSDNIVLELKQNDGTTIEKGEFANNLAKPITVYEGDEIAVNKIFIDTEAETDAIIDIPFDIQIVTTHFLSFTNDNLLKFNSFSDGANEIDNFDYYIYDVKPQGHATEGNMIHITTIASLPLDNTKNGGKVGDPDGTNPIEFRYFDVDNIERRVYISFTPPILPQADLGAQFSVSIFAHAQPDLDNRASNTLQVVQTTSNIQRCKNCNMASLVLDRPDISPLDNKAITFFSSKPGDGTFNKNFLSPTKFQFNTVIEQGKYEAQDICNIITSRMSQNDVPFSFISADSINSNFLVNSRGFTGAGNSLVGNLAQTNLQNIRTAVPNNDFFIGTNQIELQFNTNTNKFFWNFLHFPVFTTGGEISTRIIQTVAPNLSIQSRNGCVCFMSLSATNNDTGEDFDFWTDKLGFQMDKICVKPIPKENFTENGNQFTAELLNVFDGVNTTNAKIDLDSIVAKTGALANYNYQKVQVAFPSAFIQNNLNDTVEADNSTVSDIAQINTPYFLVEINAGFNTNFISTETTSSKIQAIVNRYYSKGSYTTGEDSSLAYIHRGVPIVLSKFYTRILDPTKKVPVELGEDNTVFIEIVRGQQYYEMLEEQAQQNKKNSG